jgi:hypothetical protein
MKRRRKFLCAPMLAGAAFLCVSMTGCVGSGTIQVGRDAKPVADRIARNYSVYVNKDTSIDDGERADRLRDMRLLQSVLDKAAELGN